MKYLNLLVLFLLPLGVWAQKPMQSYQNLPVFDKVVLNFKGSAEIEQGDHAVVLVSANSERKTEQVTVEVVENTLRVYYGDYNHNEVFEPHIKVKLVVPPIKKLECNGRMDVETKTPLHGSSLRIVKNGWGEGDFIVDVDKLIVESNGWSNIRLAGYAVSQSLTLNGWGGIDAFDVVNEVSRVEVNGLGGNVSLHPKTELRAEANGLFAKIFYGGNPDSDLERNGIVTIRHVK